MSRFEVRTVDGEALCSFADYLDALEYMKRAPRAHATYRLSDGERMATRMRFEWPRGLA